eukprot:scaffold4733_cov170-Alexandrium_tamarense.AAC.60
MDGECDVRWGAFDYLSFELSRTAAMDSGDGCDKRRRAVVSTTSASSDAWLVEESRGTVWTVGNKESES